MGGESLVLYTLSANVPKCQVHRKCIRKSLQSFRYVSGEINTACSYYQERICGISAWYVRCSKAELRLGNSEAYSQRSNSPRVYKIFTEYNRESGAYVYSVYMYVQQIV